MTDNTMTIDYYEARVTTFPNGEIMIAVPGLPELHDATVWCNTREDALGVVAELRRLANSLERALGSASPLEAMAMEAKV